MLLNDNFKYIDLFSGIGGFHCAMDKYSSKSRCIMACEIDPYCRKVYKDNFGLTPFEDVRKISKKDIPSSFDVICAGFPCQTFSKAGERKGFKDPRGTLFREITRIVEFYEYKDRPKVMILENVRNLITHDGGDTWRTIKAEIERVGYNVVDEPYVLSPNDFGIPQLRERAIILAVRKDVYKGRINLVFQKKDKNTLSIYDILDNKVNKKYYLSKDKIEVLNCWDDFIKGLKIKVIGFPIWSDYFKDKGITNKMPEWKVDFIKKNKDFYNKNKVFIDSWFLKWRLTDKFTPTNRKFEWQVNNKIKSLFDGIIQFRPSGVRVKQPTESPSLVALVQVPVIGKYKRYMTPKECARLQSFPDDFQFNENDNLIYKQLGNAVNVDVIYNTFSEFIHFLNKEVS